MHGEQRLEQLLREGEYLCTDRILWLSMRHQCACAFPDRRPSPGHRVCRVFEVRCGPPHRSGFVAKGQYPRHLQTESLCSHF